MTYDFYLPEKNVAIEVDGPKHYIAPSRILNQTSEAKHRITKVKGMRLIAIPYFANTPGSNVRLENLLEII